MKQIKEIYGCLYVGSVVYDMDGVSEFPAIDADSVSSIGEHEIGSEANVFIVYSDASEEQFNTTEAVVALMKKYK